MQFHRLALPPNLTSTPVDFRTAQSRHAVDAARDDYSSLWSRSIAAWMTSASAGMSAPPPSGACSSRTASRRIMVSWVRTGRSASIELRPVASSGSAANAPLRRSRSEALRFAIKLSRSVVMSHSCTHRSPELDAAQIRRATAACAAFPSPVADHDPGLPASIRRGRQRASVALAESADRVGRLRAPARAYRAASARWPKAAAGSPHRPENVSLRRTRSRHLPPSWPLARLRRGGRPTSGNKTGDAGTTRALLLLMASLQEHLDRHDVAADALAFRRDCPLCRAERVLGQLPAAGVLSPRACAAATALALATSALVPGTVVADGQGVAVPAPPSPPPPTANVQAADGGAAPAESAGGSTPVPADSEHDGGSGAPSGGSPRSAEPAGSSTHAGDAPVSSDPPTPASGEQTAPAGDPAPGGSAATAASERGSETAAPPAAASAAAPGSAPQGGAPPSASPPVAAPAPAAQPAASPAASPQAPAAPPSSPPHPEGRSGGHP